MKRADCCGCADATADDDDVVDKGQISLIVSLFLEVE